MAMIESWFEQDLKKPVQVRMIGGNVFSQDAQANRIGVRVTDGGEAATLGGTVSASIIRADGSTVAQAGTLSGNECSVVLPAAAYAVPGTLIITLKLTQSGVITTLLAVVATVYRSSTDAIVDPGTIIPSIEDLIEDIEEAVASIPADYSSLWASLAPAYSTSGSYAVGDYVTYNGNLYRCEAAIDGGESWTAAHWNQITLGGDIKNKCLHFLKTNESIINTDYGKLAANLPGNSFCWVSGSWFTDAPSGTYWLITIADTSTKTFAGQIAYVPGTGIIYTRQKQTGGNITDWKLLAHADNSFFYRGILASGSDFNSVTTNSIHGLSSTGNYTHKPPNFSSGYLFTIGYGSGFFTQIAIELDGFAIYSRWRSNSGVWYDWLSGYHDPSAQYFAFGDSTTYGQIGGASGQSKYNYPAVTGKLLSMTVLNKAVGGQGLIKNWDDIQTDYIQNLDMTDAKLITIGWSYNDGGYYSSMNFGAATDTGDTTFIGKYFTIMKQFQQKCPKAKIILVTGYGTPDGQVGPPVVKPTLETQFTYEYTFADGNHSTKEMYDTLEEMCYLHGWSCINQAKGTVFNQFNADDLIGDQIHPNNDGYYLYGQYLGAKIASCYGNVAKW